MDYSTVISIIISSVSLAFSLYTFWAYGKKLNDQQEELNRLALQKATREAEASKKANIFLDYQRKGTSEKLVISNKGKATAYDVRIVSHVEEDPLLATEENLYWKALKPDQRVSRPVALTIGCDKQVTYDMIWHDELGEHIEQQMVDYLS